MIEKCTKPRDWGPRGKKTHNYVSGIYICSTVSEGEKRGEKEQKRKDIWERERNMKNDERESM